MSKPEWAEDEYVGWDMIVRSWGYQVVDSKDFGSYQGDAVYLLKRPDEVGYVVIGYGSCSGCDALQAVRPWSRDGDWSGVESLRLTTRERVRWFPSWRQMLTYLNDQNARANDWYFHDKEIDNWLIEQAEQRRGKHVREY